MAYTLTNLLRLFEESITFWYVLHTTAFNLLYAWVSHVTAILVATMHGTAEIELQQG